MRNYAHKRLNVASVRIKVDPNSHHCFAQTNTDFLTQCVFLFLLLVSYSYPVVPPEALFRRPPSQWIAEHGCECTSAGVGKQ